jgi:hypothetical protein
LNAISNPYSVVFSNELISNNYTNVIGSRYSFIFLITAKNLLNIDNDILKHFVFIYLQINTGILFQNDELVDVVGAIEEP